MKKRFKTILIMLLTILMLFPAASYAAPKDAGIMVYLDGYSMSFEVPPVIENGTTLVPMKTIFEKLDYTVEWVPKNRAVRAVRFSNDMSQMSGVVLWIDDPTAVQQYYVWDQNVGDYVNHGKYDLTMAVPPRIINSTTMVPLRFVAEASGCDVTWDAEYRIVNIMNPGYVPDTISDEQRAINEQYVELSNEPTDSEPGAFQ